MFSGIGGFELGITVNVIEAIMKEIKKVVMKE